MIDFAAIRQGLQALHDAVGGDCLVSFAWNGKVMSVQVARPETKKRFMTVLVDEGDYVADPGRVLGQIVALAEAHFAYAPADER